DLANIGTKGTEFGPAGATDAALFLREFTGDLPWAHLDIAGPGRSTKESGLLSKGGTAFATRTLLRWLADRCKHVRAEAPGIQAGPRPLSVLSTEDGSWRAGRHRRESAVGRTPHPRVSAEGPHAPRSPEGWARAKGRPARWRRPRHC